MKHQKMRQSKVSSHQSEEAHEHISQNKMLLTHAFVYSTTTVQLSRGLSACCAHSLMPTQATYIVRISSILFRFTYVLVGSHPLRYVALRGFTPIFLVILDLLPV